MVWDMEDKIKIYKEELSGFIHAGDIDIECYHLDNGMRVISGRRLQKSIWKHLDCKVRMFQIISFTCLKMLYCRTIMLAIACLTMRA